MPGIESRTFEQPDETKSMEKTTIELVGLAGGRIGVSSFRHPVFGNYDVWVEQATRPYLMPAGRAQGPTTVKLAREALRAAVAAA
jgi:hypothetical protein